MKASPDDSKRPERENRTREHAGENTLDRFTFGATAAVIAAFCLPLLLAP